MENAGYLFAAYGVVWLVFFLYLFTLLNRQRKLRRDIDSLEESMHDKSTGDRVL